MQLPEQLAHVPLIPVVDCRALPRHEVLHAATVALLEQGVVKLVGAFDPADIASWKAQGGSGFSMQRMPDFGKYFSMLHASQMVIVILIVS